MRKLTLGVLALALGLAGCSDDDDTTGSGGSAGAAGSSAGTGGDAGSGGSANGGTAGNGGSSGSGGSAASGGSAGTSGGSGGTTGGSGGTTGGSGGTGGSAGTTGGSAGTTGGSAGTTGGTGGSAGGSAGSSGAGGSTAGTGGTGGSSAGTSVTINSDGGRLEVDGAILTFGENSVAGDTVVTGSSSSSTSGLPRAGDIHGKTYDFTPNGTAFDNPGVLVLPVSGAAPTGKQWVVAWLDTTHNTWVPVPTIQLGGRVAAAIKHFTYYAVLQANAADVTSGCNVAAPCGGALASRYDLGGFCYTGTPPGAGPFPACPSDSTGSVSTIGASLFEFSGGNFVYSLTAATKTTFHLQASCVTNLGSALTITVNSCADLEAPLSAAMKMAMVCEGNPSSQCDCSVFPSVVDSGVETGTYSTSGNQLTLTSSTKTDVLDYCVSGSTLQIAQGEFEYVYNE